MTKAKPGWENRERQRHTEAARAARMPRKPALNNRRTTRYIPMFVGQVPQRGGPFSFDTLEHAKQGAAALLERHPQLRVLDSIYDIVEHRHVWKRNSGGAKTCHPEAP